jgi:hypothetical protein
LNHRRWRSEAGWDRSRDERIARKCPIRFAIDIEMLGRDSRETRNVNKKYGLYQKKYEFPPNYRVCLLSHISFNAPFYGHGIMEEERIINT